MSWGWGDALGERFAAGRWSASWIWAADRPSEGRSVVALRRDVDLGEIGESVPARIAAVSRYILYINGDEVARGPARGGKRRQPYDVIDLAPHLNAGRNAIAILAWVYRDATPWWIPPVAGAEGAVAFEAILGDETLTTDASWLGRSLETWDLTSPGVIPGRGVETLDLSALPDDWVTADLGDWQAATERGSPMPGAWRRSQPPSALSGPHLARPITWPDAGAASLHADGGRWVADRVLSGTVRVEIEGPAGAAITFEPSDRFFQDALSRDATFSVRCDGSRRVVETLDVYGLSALAARADDGATVHAVEVVERLHPVTGGVTFECSDERLTKIWNVGRRTVSACSLDAYIDCPTREQRAWVGDSVVHQMVDLTTNEDWTLARWYPHLSASPRADGMLPMAVGGHIERNDAIVIPDWALHWIHGVYNLYRYVGDRDEIAELMPTVEGVLRWFHRACDEDGLPTALMGGVLIDWASVYVDDTSSAIAGLYGRGLLEFTEMARWLGDRSRVTWARAEHQHLKAGFERFWDERRGRYVDAINDGSPLPMASQHGQAAAIVGGLAPAGRFSTLVDVMTDEANLIHAAFSAPDGPAEPNSGVEVGGAFLRSGRPAKPWWDAERQVVRAQPFFRYVIHDALEAADRADLVAGSLFDWTSALERCDTSWAETFYGGSSCHGASSTPTRDIQMYVLGIQPAAPGYAVANVTPNLGPLEWAKGSAPTPEGPITVEVDPERIVIDSPVPFVHRGIHFGGGRQTVAHSWS